MPISHRFLPLVFTMGAVVACHSAHAAETPRVSSPSVDVEVEDRSPGAQPHLARFNVSLANGRGEITATDGDAKYALEAFIMRDAEPRMALKVKRTDRAVSSDFEVSGAIPPQAGARVVVAQINRADGRTTTIIAQPR